VFIGVFSEINHFREEPPDFLEEPGNRFVPGSDSRTLSDGNWYKMILVLLSYLWSSGSNGSDGSVSTCSSASVLVSVK